MAGRYNSGTTDDLVDLVGLLADGECVVPDARSYRRPHRVTPRRLRRRLIRQQPCNLFANRLRQALATGVQLLVPPSAQ